MPDPSIAMTRRAYSVRQLVEITSLSKSRIHELIANGTLPAKRVDKRVLVLAEEFDAWWANLPEHEG